MKITRMTYKTTIDDVKLLELSCHHEDDGTLVPVEALNDIPISISRIFYVVNASGKTRGNHAHHTSRQVLFCPMGKLEIKCFDGFKSKIFVLDSPGLALYIPEMIWDETVYSTPETVMLACSDTLYDSKQYIDDFDEFLSLKGAEQ